MLRGGAGGDLLHGNGRHDTLRGGGGRDEICGGAGHDKLWGGHGHDLLSGENGLDTLYGGSGDDRPHALPGDRLTGGAGRDYFIVDFDMFVGDYTTIQDFTADTGRCQQTVLARWPEASRGLSASR